MVLEVGPDPGSQFVSYVITPLLFVVWAGVIAAAAYVFGNYVMLLVLDAKLGERAIEIVLFRGFTVWSVPYDDITGVERVENIPLFSRGSAITLKTRWRPRVQVSRGSLRPILLTPRDTDRFIREIRERMTFSHQDVEYS